MWSEHYMFSDLAIGQGSTQYDNPPYSQYQTSSWDVQSKYSHEESQPTYQQLPYPSLYNPSAMVVSIYAQIIWHVGLNVCVLNKINITLAPYHIVNQKL